MRSRVRDGKPGIACQVMVAYTYYAIEWISPYAMLGSVHVLEGMSTLLADKAADSIQRSLGGRGKDGFSYLRSHGALDIEHVAFFKKLVNGITDAKDPADRDRRVEGVLPTLRRHLPRAGDAASHQKPCSLRASVR